VANSAAGRHAVINKLSAPLANAATTDQAGAQAACICSGAFGVNARSCRKVCDRGGDAGGLALAAGRCCSSLRLDLAEESTVDADVFYGSCHRPDAQLILLE
jgi:hypothetical protein